MALHQLITQPGIYFITFTCHQWIPLIQLIDGYDLVYTWFDILTKRNNSITGYVIMPNHLHLLLHYAGMSSSLNSAIGNGKRFMAYDIVNRLKEKNEWSILNCLQEAVRPYGRKRGKLHEIWTDAFDVKECRTENFILQKLSYIHNNPCAGKWKLVDSPIDYLHSSAAFYISGKKCGYAVRDYREFL